MAEKQPPRKPPFSKRGMPRRPTPSKKSKNRKAVIVADPAPKKRTSSKPGIYPQLEYLGAHNEGWWLLEMGGGPWKIEALHIKNTELDTPVDASNVRGEIQYQHSDGESLDVREALWHSHDFVRALHIPPNTTAVLCLWGQQRGGPPSVIEDTAHRSRVKSLKPGKWRVDVRITADNLERPFLGTGEFWVMPDHSVQYEQKPFIFTNER